MRAVIVALGIAIASPAAAATIHGLVYDDGNGDGAPSAGEAGIANAVVAFGASHFVTTDASGQFDIPVADDARGIVWVRVPDGFTPGPAWTRWNGPSTGDLDLGLRRLPAAPRGPLTFVVAADTHMVTTQDFISAAELSAAARAATALEPAPAFFTILGDVTQGNREHEFELVDAALAGLGVPFVPVPGNHDWYDGGAAWFEHYGPDNYSFDLGDTHFVVWNMAMPEDQIRSYLGAELARVPRTMTVVALTHAPPMPAVTDVLRELGVDYVLTGHTHTNRVIDHDGLLELSTQPMLMGGLDFTPAGYRVMTLDHGRLGSEHHTTIDEPQLALISPARGQCVTGELIVAAALDAAPGSVTARIDCGTPIALRSVGGWSWQVELPRLAAGVHTLQIEAATQSGAQAALTTTIEVCDPGPAPKATGEWRQIGGGPGHLGASAQELAPPLVTRWSASVGGHVLTAAPVVANATVFVAISDLANGNAGGVVALDAITGALKWRYPTAKPVRGGIAVEGDTVIAAQIDGVVLGISALTGALQWQHELSIGIAPQAGAVFAPPAVANGEVFVGHQRALSALSASTGAQLWNVDPVPEGADSQSAAAIAIGDGIAVGTFNRALGGVTAWDPETGKELWRFHGAETVAINASPVIAGDSIFVVNGADEVIALDRAGQPRWRVKLDEAGFDWGNATIGTPAFARDILVVPTLYRDLVALDAATGAELWRHAGTPSPLHATHYRGPREPGFAAAPVITGDIVWAADTAGELSALELTTGRLLWRTALGVPVLAGLASTGDGLVVASYDGSVRLLVPTPMLRVLHAPQPCARVFPAAGCCDSRDAPGGVLMLVLLVGAAIRRRRS